MSILADGPRKMVMHFRCGLCGHTAHFHVEGVIKDGVPIIDTPPEAHAWAAPHVSPMCYLVGILPPT